MKAKNSQLLIKIILGFFSLLMLYPFIYMLMGSLTTPKEFASSGLFPIPQSFEFSRILAFLKVFAKSEMINSVLFTLARTVWYLLFLSFTSVLLGYLFAKVDFSGKKFMFMFFMVSMMIPGVATIIPTFIIFARFPLLGGNNIIGLGGHGLINEWPVMFVTGLFGIYNVFLVRQSILSLGNEYKEAAEIDGAGFWHIVFKVYMPMILPVLTVIVVGLCIGMWNDYFFNKMYAYGPDVIKPIGYKITLELANFNQTNTIYPEYPMILGVSMIFMLPPIIFYILLQKYFTRGLSIGGVKG